MDCYHFTRLHAGIRLCSNAGVRNLYSEEWRGIGWRNPPVVDNCSGGEITDAQYRKNRVLADCLYFEEPSNDPNM